jgi:Asp-tRNA(Asn)/Glu-tRNA(Gln) amidotransferase C subunit
MPDMTPEAIRHLASLSRIALSDEEITRSAVNFRPS